jgi:hypothetical protein
MRYQIEKQEGNKVKVTDTITGATHYGAIENGKARSHKRLSMQIIAKAIKEAK